MEYQDKKTLSQIELGKSQPMCGPQVIAVRGANDDHYANLISCDYEFLLPRKWGFPMAKNKI